jgi:serine protease Do
MTRPDVTDPAASAPVAKRTMKRPVVVATAGALALGLLGSAAFLPADTRVAQAEPNVSSSQTPVGPSFADLVERVKPAVVSISVRGQKTAEGPGGEAPGMPPGMPGIPDLAPDHPLNEFFKRFREQQPNSPQPRPSQAQGSGFFVSADGYLVTNNHVVDGSSDIEVVLDNGDTLSAEMVGADARTDIALLKIKDAGDRKFSFVEFTDDTARVGDWVLAVGNPFGLGGTVTAGIVSAHNRDIGSGPYDYLQIDAAVNRGNSGGPTFNLEGKVVGVNTAIFSPSGGNVGIAFAVPSVLAQKVVAELKESGTVERGWLGVTIQNVNDDIAASVGLEKPTGALITGITPGGPSADSEMKVGDVVLSVDGEEIRDSRDLARKVADMSPAQEVKLEVLRDGDRTNFDVELGTFPSNQQLAELQEGKPTPDAKESGESMEGLGLSLAPAASQPGAGKDGVVITEIDPSSDAAEKGLKVGDVILQVAGQMVTSPKDVSTGVDAARKRGRTAVLMRVKSGDQERFVALTLKKV